MSPAGCGRKKTTASQSHQTWHGPSIAKWHAAPCRSGTLVTAGLPWSWRVQVPPPTHFGSRFPCPEQVFGRVPQPDGVRFVGAAMCNALPSCLSFVWPGHSSRGQSALHRRQAALLIVMGGGEAAGRSRSDTRRYRAGCRVDVVERSGRFGAWSWQYRTVVASRSGRGSRRLVMAARH